MRSFKSNENIYEKEDGSYYVVLANKAPKDVARGISPSNPPTTGGREKWQKLTHTKQSNKDTRSTQTSSLFHKRGDHNANVIQQTARLVVNPITVNKFAAHFNCTPVSWS